MYKRKVEIKLIILVCLITSSIISYFIKEACNISVQASSLFMGGGQTKFVIVSADYLELEDIAADEYLQNLYNKGYIALISSRQNGKSSVSKVKLSIGAGKRLLSNNSMVNAINTDKSAPSVVYQDIDELKNINSSNEYLNYIGYLGDKLNEAGKTTCLLGNSDTEVNNRDDILIAMDRNGYANYGDVENVLIFDRSFPGGKRTDFDKLTELYKKNFSASDLMVIDTGDLSRLDYYKSKLSPQQYELYRKQAIHRISQFIRDITALESLNTTFMILSAYPSSNNIREGFKLTPILVVEEGKEGGFLYSKSTRREGIITSLDIADYIIEKLSIHERSQLQEVNREGALNKILKLKERLLNVSLMRLPVLTWYALLEIICAMLGLFYMLSMKHLKSNKLLRFIKTTLLVNICAPAVLLYLAAFDIAKPNVFFTLFVLSSYAIVYIINRVFKETINRFTAAAFLVNFSLTIDLLKSSFLIKSSVFGYDPIIGARFYGIGNEFAGVFLGSSILLAGCLLEKFKDKAQRKPLAANILLLLYFTFYVYIIGMPTKGANFGATIAAVCGCYFFINFTLRKQINLKQLLLLAAIVIAVISLIIFIDLIDYNNTTHIGKFITDIRENGVKVLISTFVRKLEMNIRLMKYTIWTKVLLCIILVITVMFFKPVRLLYSIFKKYQHLANSWLGISAGSIAGLIVNDSGIVLAATAMIFTGFTIMYICLEEMESVKAGG